MADIGKLVIDIDARLSSLEGKLGTAETRANKAADNINKTFKNTKLNFDDSLMKMKLNELQQLGKNLQKELERKIKMGADAGSIETTKTQLDAVRSKLQGINNTVDQGKSKISQFFTSNLGKMASFTTALIVIKKLFSEAVDSAKLENLKKAFDSIATKSGADSVQLLKDLKEATAGTLKEFDLLKTVNRGSFLGVDVKTMPTLLHFAALRAQETGENIDYLVDSIVTGIGRKSPLILDNLGLTMKELDKATLLVARDHGDLTGKIDENTRSLYLNEAAVIVAQKAIKNSNVSLSNLSTDTAKLESNWDSLLKLVGSKTTPVFSWIVGALDSIAQGAYNAGRATRSFLQSLGLIKKEKIELEVTYKQPKIPMQSTYNYVPDVKIKTQAEIDAAKAAAQKKEDTQKSFYDNMKYMSKDYLNYYTKQVISDADAFLKAGVSKIDTQKYVTQKLKEYWEGYEAFLKNSPVNDNGTYLSSVKTADQIGGDNLIGKNGKIKDQAMKFVEQPAKPLVEFNKQLSFTDQLAGTVASTFASTLASSVKVFGQANSLVQQFINSLAAAVVQMLALKAAQAALSFFGLATGGSVTNFGGGNVSASSVPKFAGGVSSFMVPPTGKMGDSFPILVAPGEQVDVTPANKVGRKSDNGAKLISDKIDQLTFNMVQGQFQQPKFPTSIPLFGKIAGDDIWISNDRTGRKRSLYN